MHTYELIEHEWTVTVVAPTCTDDGYTLNECSCGNSYISDETTALGHDYTETTSGNDTIFTCSVCGHSYTQHTHNYATTTVVAPTCTAKGYTLHECACGHSYKTNETAALGHNFQLMVCTRCGYRQGSGGIIQPPVQPPVDIMSLDANETELVDGCEQYRITSTTEVRHDYIYASGKLLRETITTTVDGEVTDTDVLDFIYDQNGRPYSFTYNGTEYYYILNLQGDVERIYNANGSSVASYNYNAWGEVINQSGTMADVNPIRYRGYYYDNELEMYYLQSRYYDPTICRFINMDAYASTGQGFVGYNMFAYCGNNPTCCVDYSGGIATSVLINAAIRGFIDGLAAGSTTLFFGGSFFDATMAFVEGFTISFVSNISSVFSIAYSIYELFDVASKCVALGVSQTDTLLIVGIVLLMNFLPAVEYSSLKDVLIEYMGLDYLFTLLPTMFTEANIDNTYDTAQERREKNRLTSNCTTDEVFTDDPPSGKGGGRNFFHPPMANYAL